MKSFQVALRVVVIPSPKGQRRNPHLPHLVALRQRVIASGPPSDVIVPDVLEQVFGARMEVLMHLGMPVVVDVSSRTIGVA